MKLMDIHKKMMKEQVGKIKRHYYKEHVKCPQCKSKMWVEMEQKVINPMSNRFVDKENKAKCTSCNWNGVAHDLLMEDGQHADDVLQKQIEAELEKNPELTEAIEEALKKKAEGVTEDE